MQAPYLARFDDAGNATTVPVSAVRWRRTEAADCCPADGARGQACRQTGYPLKWFSSLVFKSSQYSKMESIVTAGVAGNSAVTIFRWVERYRRDTRRIEKVY